MEAIYGTATGPRSLFEVFLEKWMSVSNIVECYAWWLNSTALQTQCMFSFLSSSWEDGITSVIVWLLLNTK